MSSAVSNAGSVFSGLRPRQPRCPCTSKERDMRRVQTVREGIGFGAGGRLSHSSREKYKTPLGRNLRGRLPNGAGTEKRPRFNSHCVSRTPNCQAEFMNYFRLFLFQAPKAPPTVNLNGRPITSPGNSAERQAYQSHGILAVDSRPMPEHH